MCVCKSIKTTKFVQARLARSSSAMLEHHGSPRSTRSSRLARHVERVESCRDVTCRAKWNWALLCQKLVFNYSYFYLLFYYFRCVRFVVSLYVFFCVVKSVFCVFVECLNSGQEVKDQLRILIWVPNIIRSFTLVLSSVYGTLLCRVISSSIHLLHKLLPDRMSHGYQLRQRRY